MDLLKLLKYGFLYILHKFSWIVNVKYHFQQPYSMKGDIQKDQLGL